MDITSLSVAQLKELLAQLPKEIAHRENVAKVAALKEMEAVAASHGFKLTDLISSQPAVSRAAIKFRHPTDASLTWSGRGRAPMWYKTFIANGGSVEQLTA